MYAIDSNIITYVGYFVLLFLSFLRDCIDWFLQFLSYILLTFYLRKISSIPEFSGGRLDMAVRTYVLFHRAIRLIRRPGAGLVLDTRDYEILLLCVI